MDGVFDLFHIGHLKAIQECTKIGNRVIIGVTGDEDATGYKRRPVMGQDERSAIVAAVNGVSYVVCPCPLVVTEAFMDEHKIDLVAHGFANEADAERQTEFFEIPMRLGKFRRIPYTVGVSTTERIGALQRQGEEPAASKRNPKWFGSCVAEATDKSWSIPYQPFPLDLRIAIEPHLQKALKRRSETMEAVRQATGPKIFDVRLSEFEALPVGQEFRLSYKTDTYDLRRELLRYLGHADSSTFELCHLHKSPRAKDTIFTSLVESPGDFQQVYDEFVRGVCIPQIAAMCPGEVRFHYQAFPCIRIVQPGEFSIGPHCDVSYGHHPCSINCYVLLTDITDDESASVLFLESAPNRQDWHPILGSYGTIHCFPGAISTHWTTENHTRKTRVSLDFRIIPGSFFEDFSCGGSLPGGQKDVYRMKSGYYNSCRREENCDEPKWTRRGPIVSPKGDPRFGYPWTGMKKS